MAVRLIDEDVDVEIASNLLSVLFHYALFNAILTELNANDVNVISIDRQKLDLSKD